MTFFFGDGETAGMGRGFTTLQRLKDGCLDAVSSRGCSFDETARDSLLLATLTDLDRSKSELIMENALLRQQLIVLWREVKRPTFTSTDRILFVLLARLVRTWQQAHITRVARHPAEVASGALKSVLETSVKDCFSYAEVSRGNHRPDQRDGDE